ncbi:uncharacterized protein PHACADRAFT_264171 [Phanerochaete carnosa HHB-10118-sp]|uniref:Myosin-binding domain-containing protein n=1 Tax=Phanerochaete carnosa (strain HHB-10118-sp) TaxID=650164 RepID=K5VHK0_PHACS|nr:uncharacterized protein PHACADRAFT_264171 [Phanerochaete carnosa HHB-10118-sp]EKM50723.1 hypothetical protein PHACADRAFT_264171 [Phanerochaete carnosa HHB-10118-sp]
MAQPLFNEHPLQEYFQETGEDSEPMPGSDAQFIVEAGPRDPLPQESVAAQLVTKALQRVHDVYNSLSTHRPSSSNTFAERFKYDVISSSLLSISLAASPNPARRTFKPEIPGRLRGSAGGHSRASSTTEDDEALSHHYKTVEESTNVRGTITVVSVAVVALAAGYEFLGLLMLASVLYFAKAVRPIQDVADAHALTLDALNELISAGNVWDSSVNEVMSIIEKEERSPSSGNFYGPASPLFSLRIALQTSLHTTQSQCDNVRQLLSALTSPPQLAQLSEMYAPASPVKPSFFTAEQPRPLSDPIAAWRRRTLSTPAKQAAINKRATWSPSRSSLAAAAELNGKGRAEKRRSDAGSVFLAPGVPSSSMSAPATPLSQRMLEHVEEEEQRDSDPDLAYTKEEDVFGVAALNMQRRRRMPGMETFSPPPPSYSSTIRPLFDHHSLGHSPHNSISSVSSPSRFTLLQTNRHPLSLSSLHLALHGALGAKRYACAHLLALRFEEDADDETYWEDVRSVMALLTSTCQDASASLLSALDEAEKKRMKDERPSTESLLGSSRESSLSPEAPSKQSVSRSAKIMAEMISFAPIPSHLTRFATHVDAVSSALNDAREHLEQCVVSIREDKHPDTSLQPAGVNYSLDPFSAEGNSENPALQAYDRLRKELGYALRECERGREQLLAILVPAKPEPETDEEDEFADALPPLAHDLSSEDSTSPDSAFSERNSTFEIAAPDLERTPQPLDDATERLLMDASSQHLPPSGIEQVFEADTGASSGFTRERSKLSREERIQLAKARRESGLAGLAVYVPQVEVKPQREQWGPGGEVVQELKDVIWKVGEKRRKMSERAGSLGAVQYPPSLPIDACKSRHDVGGVDAMSSPAASVESVS